MHNLGQTRSSQQSNHLLITADTFVRNILPGMNKCSAIVHAGPAIGAQFAQYTAEFEAGGELGSTPAQRGRHRKALPGAHLGRTTRLDRIQGGCGLFPSAWG